LEWSSTTRPFIEILILEPVFSIRGIVERRIKSQYGMSESP
jgi:hypothetical protein